MASLQPLLLSEACALLGCEPSEVIVHSVKGGITNQLFRLELKSGSDVLLRLYGAEGL